MVEGGIGGRAGGPRSKPDSAPTQGSERARGRRAWRIATVGLLIALVVGGLSAQTPNLISATTPPNKEPEIVPIDHIVVPMRELMTIAIVASDPEGDPLTFHVSYLPEGAFYVPLGDTSLDEHLDSVDAALVLQAVAGLWMPSAEALTVSDVNLDGGVTSVDAQLILQGDAGLLAPLNTYLFVWTPPHSINLKFNFSVEDATGGDGESVSLTVSGGPLPAAPSDLQATAIGPTEVVLTWTDNAANEAGFMIGRSRVYGPPYDFLEDKTYAPDVETFTDSQSKPLLKPDTWYGYTLRSYNYDDAGHFQMSDPSDSVMVQTPPETP